MDSASAKAPASAVNWEEPPSAGEKTGTWGSKRGSVFDLRLSLLLRIGWACLIIAVLEDYYLHPLMTELLCFCLAGHGDVDVVAVHLPTSVFDGIVARILASAINPDAAV